MKVTPNKFLLIFSLVKKNPHKKFLFICVLIHSKEKL